MAGLGKINVQENGALEGLGQSGVSGRCVSAGRWRRASSEARRWCRDASMGEITGKRRPENRWFGGLRLGYIRVGVWGGSQDGRLYG